MPSLRPQLASLPSQPAPVGQDPVVRCQNPVVWCQDPVVWCQDPVDPVGVRQDPVDNVAGPCVPEPCGTLWARTLWCGARTLWCLDPVVWCEDPVGQDPVDPVGQDPVVRCQDPVVWCQDPVVWCQDPVSQDPVVWCQDPVSHNPVVAEAMLPFLTDHFGNPSSGHVYGQKCKAAVELARQQVAQLLCAAPADLVFTSCGTESDNWAISGAVNAAHLRWAAEGREEEQGEEEGRDAEQGEGEVPSRSRATGAGKGKGGAAGAGRRLPHVVTSAVEHPAVLAHLRQLQTLGQASFTAVGVDAEGLVDPEAVLAAVTRDTVLVSIMHSNNEVGSLQPIAAISAGLRKAAPQVLLHTDAAQSLGKVAVDVEALGVDLLTLVGHKLGAPKGVAALWVRPGRPPLAPFLHGGSQEAGRRAGTENVLLLVGLGKAAEIARLEGAATARHMQTMRDYMQQRLVAAFAEGRVRVNGPSDPDLRLPNTLSISIAGLSAAAALVALADKLAASAGAACHSSGASLSSVLREMGVDPIFGAGTLRLSVGRHTTLAEVERAVELIVEQAAVQGICIKQPLST
ncbi:hypothetical protein QJQ45_009516 [Haematococcus lacustris]|nr:hypothetical protein QJQ45_009516 [Haematococcus lacustris]